MNPSKFEREFQKAINHFLMNEGDPSLFTPRLISRARREHRRYCRDQFDDLDNAYDTKQDWDYNYGQMLYISDRWRVSFRIKWIINSIREFWIDYENRNQRV